MPDPDIVRVTRGLATSARAAARVLARAKRVQKDTALRAITARIRASPGALLEANRVDVARYRNSEGATPALTDRLTLTEARLEGMAGAVDEIAAQEDPIGAVTGMTRRPNGLLVGQVSIPLGVIAMIYEARPNVTVDAAALCLKSGNAVLLRGGSEARDSNAALVALVRAALVDAALPPDAVQLVPPGDRDAIRALLSMTGLIDLAIPRGGEGLVRFVAEHAKVPVIQHYQGVCHLYVDQGADHDTALALIIDGKALRPGVCNALECLLVHEAEAPLLLPALAARAAAHAVELRGCARTVAIVPSTVPAAPDDYGREFLDMILAVRVVADLAEALAHVEKYGSSHTEAICTPSYDHAQVWLDTVDASCVLVNASTRFNDGGELGLGAEIGISTSKLHAFGPMGVDSLTSKKWIVYGGGQVRG
ncbi:MAG TPA: glutamate-5-semialdehyde dehydrogenase [Polyangiaceae bacterium]|nr:glutamate-5-semialdehyde dehydrogenase [Polyangiaceae bacterium]